jgi:hypothetical protein
MPTFLKRTLATKSEGIEYIEQLEKSSPLNTEQLFAGYYQDNKVSLDVIWK